MKVRLNPGVRIDEYQYSKDLRLTKVWQTVPAGIGKKLLRSEYKGRPLVETAEAEAGEAEVEVPEVVVEDGYQEGES
jgi:hypothetical protein